MRLKDKAVEHGNMPSENEAVELLTTQISSGRMGVPRDIADGVVFLASDESCVDEWGRTCY